MEVTERKSFRLVLGIALSIALIGAFAVLAGCEADEPVVDGEDPPAADVGPIEIGWVPWDDAISVSWLWKHILEREGYEVELTQLDIAPVYAGVASGDLHLYLSAWLPITHADYAEEFDHSWEYLSVWNDNGRLTWTVPEYVEVDSISDLAGQSDMFDGRIVGIESGAGLMRISEDDVIPGYGLEEYELIEGSTTAMLAELDRAIRNEEPIVVTLWRPHWAYGEYPLRDLADPEGLLGEAEEMHVVAHEDFSSDYPQVAEWLRNFQMSDDEIGSLINTVMNEYGQGPEDEAIEAWLADADNQALVDSWLGR